MHYRLQRVAARRALLLLAGLLPFVCAVIWFCLVLLAIPPGGTVQIGRRVLLAYSALGVLVSMPAAVGVLYLLRARSRSGPAIEVLAVGLEPGDHALMQELFPNSEEVRLSPLEGGFSGATVLRAQSWGGGALQRTSVVKVGTAAKLQPEVDNFERYVREYVGNTAALLHVAQRGGRMALRWAYAAFIGERVQTLADYAAGDASLVPIIQELFASQSTLGLLLGTPRRDTHYALYRSYSWTPRDWQRIRMSCHDLLQHWPAGLGQPRPDPVATVARWCDPDTGSGERADGRFDVPIATIHGDLNSRNVLIDERGSIFVIDFAHAGPGHLLRDFARLEVELLLVLHQPTEQAALCERVQQADRLIHTPGGAAPATLRDLLAARPATCQRDAAIMALRQQAHDLAGPWLSTPATSYLLALLHATLDTLRYAQCNVETRRAALLIACHLCDLLE
jgi:hypothetical protein